jgi:hypothetical protein
MAQRCFLAIRQTHVPLTTLSLPIFPLAVPYATTHCDNTKYQRTKVDAVAELVTTPMEM